MQTRIKFIYDTEDVNDANLGTSRQPFRIDGKDLWLHVYFKELRFEVADKDGNVVTTGGNTKSRTVLLRQAKKALANLGYNFGQERRTKPEESLNASTELKTS